MAETGIATEGGMLRYRSFVLQVWCGNRYDHRQWVARLEGLQDGHRLQFTDPDALLAHLRALFDPGVGADLAPSEPIPCAPTEPPPEG